MRKFVEFNYKNRKGEIALRQIVFERLHYILLPGYGYQPGWFITGICQTKQSRRSFALSNIILDDLKYSHFFDLMKVEE
jgi:hypothetical protein